MDTEYNQVRTFPSSRASFTTWRNRAYHENARVESDIAVRVRHSVLLASGRAKAHLAERSGVIIDNWWCSHLSLSYNSSSNMNEEHAHAYHLPSAISHMYIFKWLKAASFQSSDWKKKNHRKFDETWSEQPKIHCTYVHKVLGLEIMMYRVWYSTCGG